MAWTVLADRVWPVRAGLAAVCTVSTVGRCTEKYCVLPLSPLQPVGRPTAPPKTAPHSVLDGEASPLCGRRYNGCLEEIERRMWRKRVVGPSGQCLTWQVSGHVISSVASPYSVYRSPRVTKSLLQVQYDHSLTRYGSSIMAIGPSQCPCLSLVHLHPVYWVQITFTLDRETP